VETETDTSKSQRRSLWSVVAVQSQNAFNDNLVKYVLIGLAISAASGTTIGDKIEYILSALLPIPFVLLAPVAGFFSDRYSKNRIIMVCVIVQVLVFGLITLAVLVKSIPLGILGFFLLSVQSTFFSPAKLGILKELVGSSRLTAVNGIMQTGTMLAILGGMYLGGIWFDDLLQKSGDPWKAALVPIGCIGLFSVVSILLSLRIEKTPDYSGMTFHKSIFWEHFTHLHELFKNRTLRLTALGIAFYWCIAYFLGLIFVSFGKELYPDVAKGGALSQTAGMTALVGIGLMVGSLLVSALSRRRTELGMVPLGGLGLALGLLGLGLSEPGNGWFNTFLVIVGFFSGFFLVPLSAHFQDQAADEQRGRMLSANALLNSLAGALVIMLGLLFSTLGLSPSTQVLFFVPLTMAATIYVAKLLPQNLIRFLVLSTLRTIYRIRPIADTRVPATGGTLMVANHLSYLDAFIISAACPRDVRFVIFDHYYSVKWMRPFLKLFGVVPISKTRAKDAIRVVADALKAGDLVCIFPEGQLTRTGCLNEIKKGFELMVRKSKAPVLPVYMDCLWGSIFTYERGRFFKKKPYHFPYHVQVNFGVPIPPEQATAPAVRAALTTLSAEAFGSRKELEQPLAKMVTCALSHSPWKPALIEYSGDRRTLSRATVLATAAALGEKWRDSIPGDRVGVLLPNSSTSSLIHLGLVFAGKTPVAIPLQNKSGRDNLKKTYEENGITTLVTSEKFQDILTDHYFPEDTRDMGKELRATSSSGLFWKAASAYLPFLGSIDHGGDSAPKGSVAYIASSDGGNRLVELSNRQLLACHLQLNDTNIYRERDVILSGRALASPGGLLFSLYYPLLKGIPLVMLPQKITPERVAEAIGTEKVSWTVDGQSYPLPDDFSPRVETHIISNGDALPAEGLPCLVETDTGALITVSMPDPSASTVTAQKQTGAKHGSYGRLLPGLAIETGDNLKITGASTGDKPAVIEGESDVDGFLFPMP